MWKPREKEAGWELEKTLIEETPGPRGHQRPLISSLLPLDDSARIALTDFQGAVKVVDVETGKVFRTFREHVGRAWNVIALENSTIASGADDRTVKIWDARKKIVPSH